MRAYGRTRPSGRACRLSPRRSARSKNPTSPSSLAIGLCIRKGLPPRDGDRRRRRRCRRSRSGRVRSRRNRSRRIRSRLSRLSRRRHVTLGGEVFAQPLTTIRCAVCGLFGTNAKSKAAAQNRKLRCLHVDVITAADAMESARYSGHKNSKN